MMKEEQYPYNQPPWRRSYEATSPDGQSCARIDNASEIYMSGPTRGILSIDTLFDIPDCSPAFIWSDNSRFLAVPQWKYFFRRRERLLVVDIQTKSIFVYPSKFLLLELQTLSNGVITGVDSILRDPRQVRIPISEVMKEFEVADLVLLKE